MDTSLEVFAYSQKHKKKSGTNKQKNCFKNHWFSGDCSQWMLMLGDSCDTCDGAFCIKTYQESLTSRMASGKNVFIPLFPATTSFMLFRTSVLY